MCERVTEGDREGKRERENEGISAGNSLSEQGHRHTVSTTANSVSFTWVFLKDNLSANLKHETTS